MPQHIGRFEILSEIAHSDTARVYKASDPESGQTVALKVLQADLASGEISSLVQSVLEEAETTKVLSSHNIAVLYGAGEIDGKFCAATEYIQGKSVAGMLEQHDTFSIWDLMDVARQACQGLDHAHTRKVVHYTLEPAKIVVTWDGTVKILGFGISCMGAPAAQATGKVPETLRYMSPEQLQGDLPDARSNFFSLGAILYEMVTNRKAFAGDNPDQVRQEITVGMPVAPVQINSKIHPGLSKVIMKALAKAPDQRYQSGQELINDLESCKENTQKAAPRKMPSVNARAAEPPADSGDAMDGGWAPPKAAAAAAAGPAPGVTQRLAPANSPRMSAAVAHPEPETVAPPPKPAAPAGNGAKRPSFSEVDSLPPLKEVYVAPPPPPEPEPLSEEHAETSFHGSLLHEPAEAEKPTAAELAKKAVDEIRKIPPKLFVYSIGGAVCVILIVLGLIFSRIHSESAEENSAPAPAAPSSTELQPSTPIETRPGTSQVSSAPIVSESHSTGASPDVISVTPKRARPKPVKVAPPPAPVIIPGQLSVSSTPAGAQVLVDGHHNPAWLTPFDLAGLSPGEHLVSVSKPGYSPENRTIEVASGSKSFLVVQLAPLGATALISSVPSGAEVFMDGRDTGRGTPSQIQIEKLGSHIFTVRKEGYLEESTTATLQAGQSFQYAPVLRALGVTDDIKLGGRFKKMFGGSETAGMGTVAVKTQPKGAQVSVNRHVVDKTSPVDFFLNPGTYVIDITLSGYKDVHRVVNVDRGGKVAVDEILERE